MGKGCMCCLGLGLCHLSQFGYLLDEWGNDGFNEFLFKVIVANGCSQKPLSLCRDLYSRSTEQSLSFFCCRFLHYQPRFAGLKMVTVAWSVSVQLVPPPSYFIQRLAWFLLVVTRVLVALCPLCTNSLPGGLPAWFLHTRPRSLHQHRDLMFPHRYSGV